MKTIGFVCEGPRDSDILEAVISQILGEEISPLYLQPEPSLTGENGNGWKGVWSWCYKNGETLDQLMQGATPKIDLIIIQMDGDVSRKEREVHCLCYTDNCPHSGSAFPLKCKQQDCPIDVPCAHHDDGASGFADHLQKLLLSYFPGVNIPVCIVPCDSSDAWVVAAYEDISNIEGIDDPWTNIIARKKDYHGIRVPGHKKTKTVYDKFIPTVCKNWELVKRRCPQAEIFDRVISSISSHF